MFENRIGEQSRRSGSKVALAAALVATVLLGGSEAGNSSNDQHRNTVVCGRGTYLKGVTFDAQGHISTERATRISYLELPDEERVPLYDSEHKASSRASGGDRSDPADRNSDATFGLGAEFRLDFNGQGEVTNVQRLGALPAEQINAACGRVVMSVVG